MKEFQYASWVRVVSNKVRSRGKGCSPQMAQKIIELLLNDSGVCGLLAGTLESRLDCPKRQQQLQAQAAAASQSSNHKPRRRSRKLSAPVVDFLHARRDLPIPELLEEVKERFGVTISSGSVYKAWKLKPTDQQRSA